MTHIPLVDFWGFQKVPWIRGSPSLTLDTRTFWSPGRWLAGDFIPTKFVGKYGMRIELKWVMFSIAMLNYLRVSIDDNRCVCIGWISTARLECRRIETSESRKSPQFQHFDVFFNSGWLKFLSTPGRTNGSYLWDGWFHHDLR